MDPHRAISGLCTLFPIILSTIKVVLAPLFWHVLLIVFLISIARPRSDAESTFHEPEPNSN